MLEQSEGNPEPPRYTPTTAQMQFGHLTIAQMSFGLWKTTTPMFIGLCKIPPNAFGLRKLTTQMFWKCGTSLFPFLKMPPTLRAIATFRAMATLRAIQNSRNNAGGNCPHQL